MSFWHVYMGVYGGREAAVTVVVGCIAALQLYQAGMLQGAVYQAGMLDGAVYQGGMAEDQAGCC